jgi:hypothetical protein
MVGEGIGARGDANLRPFFSATPIGHTIDARFIASTPGAEMSIMQETETHESTVRPVKCATIAIVFGLIGLSSLPARALNGSQLYNVCLPRVGAGDIICVFYLRGLINGSIGTLPGPKGTHSYCPPDDGIAPDQARLIVQKFLRDHPERLDEDAESLASEALMDAFACSKKTK